METNKVFKNVLITTEIVKISHKILQLEFCKNTLLCNFELSSKHFPCSMTKPVVETAKKTTKRGIKYNFFFQRKQIGSNFSYHSNGWSKLKFHLHNHHETILRKVIEL